jgi:GT2 family glycosyltransferase
MISIITVNFNQYQVTRELVESLEKQDFQEYELVIVDNGSSKDHREIAALADEKVRVVFSEENLGFAGGNNLGISKSKGELIFLVNNDTEIPPGTLCRLSMTMDMRPDIGVLCPMIYYHADSEVVQYAGYSPINPWTGRNHALGYKERLKLTNEIRGTEYAHGAAMMVRREVLGKVGVMSENYFLYYEELDWSERIKQAGYAIAVDHNAYILHKESVSTGPASPLKTYFQTRNRILFIRRNGRSKIHKAMFFAFFLLAAAPKNILGYLLRGKWDHLTSFVAGAGWNLNNDVASERIGYKYEGLRRPTPD